MKKIVLSIFCFVLLSAATKAQLLTPEYLTGFKTGIETAEYFKKMVLDAHPEYGITYDVKYYKPDPNKRFGIDLEISSPTYLYGYVAITEIVYDPNNRLVDLISDPAISVQIEFLNNQVQDNPTDENLGILNGFMARVSGKR